MFHHLGFVAFLGVATVASVATSRECNWGEEAKKRFDDAEKGYQSDADRIERLKNQTCSQMTDQTARTNCMKTYDSILIKMAAARQKGREAYQQCDHEASEEAIKQLEELVKLAGQLANLFLVPPFANMLSILPPDTPMALSASATKVAGTFGAGPVTYDLDDDATLDVVWGSGSNNPVLDTFSLTGSLTIDTTGLTPPFVIGIRYPVTITAGNLVVVVPGFVFGGGFEFDVDTTSTVVSWLRWDGTTFVGRANAYYDWGQGPSRDGYAALSLPIAIPANGAIADLSTAGNVDFETLWPLLALDGYSAPAKMAPQDFFHVSQTTVTDLYGLAANTTAWVVLAPAVAAPQGTFLGLPWDLDQTTHQLFTTLTTDAGGAGQFSLTVPPDVNLIGALLAWQSIGSGASGLVETNSVVTEIMP